jgi:hypothetical protein
VEEVGHDSILGAQGHVTRRHGTSAFSSMRWLAQIRWYPSAIWRGIVLSARPRTSNTGESALPSATLSRSLLTWTFSGQELEAARPQQVLGLAVDGLRRAKRIDDLLDLVGGATRLR